MRAGHKTVGQWTRGWEVLGHWVAMGRVSATRHIVVSAVVGLGAGCALVWSSLSAPEQQMASDYLRCHAAQALKGPKGFGTYESLGGRWAHGEACAHIQAQYGGRTLGFVARQVGLQAGVLGLVVSVLLAVLLVRFGARLKTRKHLRGCRIVDTGRQRRERQLRRAALALVVGLSAATGLALWEMSGQQRALLKAHTLSWLAQRSHAIAWVLSPDGSGSVIWYSDLEPPGFRRPHEVGAVLNEVFAGRTPPAILLEVLLVGVAMAGVLWVVALPRRRCPDDDLVLGGVPIPRRFESYHAFFCGSPGSGKSTAIKELLDQIQARGERAIVYDCSGEYIEHFCRPGHDAILNPLDARSQHWTPWADVRSAESYYAMGRALFPPEGRDPFWADAGAQLFAHAAQVVGERAQPTNAELARMLLDMSPEQLSGALRGTPAARLVDKAAGAMPQNLLATVTSKLAGWRVLSDPKQGTAPFSIRHFVDDAQHDKWLFMLTRQDQHDTLRPLLSLWCDIAASAILSRSPSQAQRIWIILDELASLQKLPGLPNLLERGRKHGAACVLGLQSVSQLRLVYGRDGAAALAAQPQSWLVLRTVEPETARWLEQALGMAEVEQARESMSMGAASIRDGVSLQQHTENRSLVMASEIMNLPDMEGYLNLPGDEPINRVRYHYRQRRRINVAHEAMPAEAA